MDDCAITSKSKSNYTCLTKNDLLEIAKKLSIKNNNNINKKDLHRVVTAYFGTDETKWVLTFKGGEKIKKKLELFTFKNFGPLKPTEWVTNIQINNAMYQIIEYLKQYNKLHFKFYDTVSSDTFKLYPSKITDIKNLLKKNKSVGIVFNTDIDKLPGSHWTSVYITPKKAEFFDSNGEKPNKHIQKFLGKFDNWSYNTKTYQMIDGDCGLWSIMFLLKKALRTKMNNSDTDYTVNKLRGVFFRV